MNDIAKNIKYRYFVFFLVAVTGLLVFTYSTKKDGKNAPKTIILGIDGMDPWLLGRFMDEGKLPNFSKLKKTGGFRPMGTSVPPQSPVAWSDFITGSNPGAHGIFDFIHRDPSTMEPYLSTSVTTSIDKAFSIGDYRIPLSGGSIELKRKGTAFWEILEENGIPCTIFKIPANYPPVNCGSRSISGMGTPDILGGYGQYSFFTSDPAWEGKNLTGGSATVVHVEDHTVNAVLNGPVNSLKRGEPNVNIPFSVYIDRENPAAMIEIQDERIILNEGDWSQWVQIDFELIPYMTSITGIVRFYLKSAGEDFALYVSPVNIDPSNPAQPVSTPEGYSQELVREAGSFYTQGMPEDTKALDEGVFTEDEYIKQSDIVLTERLRLFRYELERFSEGLLFFYFSTLDQNSHMFWNLFYPDHPTYSAEAAAKYSSYIERLYVVMDGVLGRAMEKADENTTLIVMSDHGFAPFYKSFSLNSWLRDEEYLTVFDIGRESSGEFLQDVRWFRTRAYALGLNGLYINLKGREKNGIVESVDKDRLIEEIRIKLLAIRDPETGEQVIRRVYRSDEIYRGEYSGNAPDLILGYARGYRSSDKSASGSFTEKILEPNLTHWNGDHCMAAELVPGVLLSNRKIIPEDPELSDLASTVLNIYGLPVPESMKNRNVLESGIRQ